MRNMADLLILNILTLLCFLPIITIGPSLCALFSLTLKIARDEPVETVRMFFSALKRNFFQGIILGSIAIFAAIVIAADGIYAFSLEGKLRIVFCIVTGIVLAVWMTYVCYVFALQARYENTVIGQIRNAFMLAFVSPLQTILMWLILAAPVLLFLLLPEYVVIYTGVFWLLFGVSLPALGISSVLRKIFERFDKGQDQDSGSGIQDSGDREQGAVN